MPKCQVGELYYEIHAEWPESIDFNIHNGQPEVRLYFEDVTQQDIDNIGKGRMDFSLFVQGPVIFFLYNFGSIGWSDAPFSCHRSQTALPDEADPMLPLKTVKSQLHLRVSVIEANTGILKALRTVSLSPKFSAKLTEVVETQAAAPWPGEEEYEAVVRRVYRRNSNPTVMFRLGLVTRRGENV